MRRQAVVHVHLDAMMTLAGLLVRIDMDHHDREIFEMMLQLNAAPVCAEN